MKPPLYLLLGLAVAALGLSGCARHEAEVTAHVDDDTHGEHEEHDHGDADESGIAFVPGRGLRLSADVVEALGLQTATVQAQTSAPERTLTVQVYTVAPRVLASARLPADHADEYAGGRFQDAKLVQVDRSAVTATSLADLVFELPLDPPHQPGDFVVLTLAQPCATFPTVPRTAVLDGAASSFVYVVDGDCYRRTPVQTGPRADAQIGITAGLQAGDHIVTTAVDQLWLAELRLTKGGGHSH